MLLTTFAFSFINIFIFTKCSDYIKSCLHVVGTDKKIGFSIWKYFTFMQDKYYIETKIFNKSGDIINEYSFAANLNNENCETSGLTILRRLQLENGCDIEIKIFYGQKKLELDVMKAFLFSDPKYPEKMIQLEGLNQWYKIQVFLSFKTEEFNIKEQPEIIWSNELLLNKKSYETYCFRFLNRGIQQTFKLCHIPEETVSDRHIITISAYDLNLNDTAKKELSYLAEAYTCHRASPTSMNIVTNKDILSIKIKITDVKTGNSLIAIYHNNGKEYFSMHEFDTYDAIGIKIKTVDENQLYFESSSVILYPGNTIRYSCSSNYKFSFIDVDSYYQKEYSYKAYIGDEEYFDIGIIPMKRADKEDEENCYIKRII